ncbi:MAG: hypothetical protein WBA07_07535 [Rivularia sp. (in: cyanobacteria)]
MTTSTNKMGIVTTKIIVTNLVDEILAERGFIPSEQVRSITLDNVLVEKERNSSLFTKRYYYEVRFTA